MRKSVSVLCVVAAFAFVYAMSFASCGNVDPADAPIGAIVQFTQDDESITHECDTIATDPITGVSTGTCSDRIDSRWVTAIVSDSVDRTGGTSTDVGAPLNNVEIRWTTWPLQNDELYLVDDPIGQVPPLSQPYFTETDDRGVSEVIWRFHTGGNCDGSEATHYVIADVGTAQDRIQITVTCNEPPNVGDDDDSA